MKNGVWDSWALSYIIDSTIDIFEALLELSILPAINMFWAIFILSYNFDFSGFYLYLSLMYMCAVVFSVITMILRIFYSIDGIIIVATNYYFEEPVQMRMMRHFNQFDNDSLNLLFSLFIYFEYLLLGNERLSALSDIVFGLLLVWHPVTFAFSWYYLIQIPIELLLDFFIFPLFQMFNAPLVIWISIYLNDIN